jgi:hypothetical protein
MFSICPVRLVLRMWYVMLSLLIFASKTNLVQIYEVHTVRFLPSLSRFESRQNIYYTPIFLPST